MKSNRSLSFLVVVASLLSGKSAFAEHYGEPAKVMDFVSRDQILTNVMEIEGKGLQSSQIPNLPWSDTFWPDLQGSIASPYSESAAPKLPIFWALNGPYFTSREVNLWNQPISNLTSEMVDNLSPAEKYDLLLGDTNFTLSRQVIGMVNELYKDDQTATWSGVCHGWAPASLNLERPLRAFTLKSPLGMPITFYPSDVKALASFLWGKSYAQDYVKIEGWQCKKTLPATDNNGRLKDSECFDVNPGFFHLLLVNQIGLNQRGLIIDRSYKKRIMNQPVYGYEITYYSPTSRMPVRDARSAIVSVGDYYNDPFKKWRSPKTRAVMGVETKILYRKETTPNHDRVDSVKKDEVDNLVIHYDLELDENLNIVGGEWRDYDKGDDAPESTWMNHSGGIPYEGSDRSHPDIVWLTPPGLKAFSIADYDLEDSNWDLSTPAPQSWRDAANKAARNRNNMGKLQPQPLSRVVDMLIEMSRK